MTSYVLHMSAYVSPMISELKPMLFELSPMNYIRDSSPNDAYYFSYDTYDFLFDHLSSYVIPMNSYAKHAIS